jgi:predicted transcriptional regulator
MNETNEPNSKKESEEVAQILRLLACSDLRNNLARALRDGKKMTLSQLSDHVGASSPACVHALRELTKEHVTRQDEKRNYLLTNIGEIVTRKFEEVNATIAALSQHREFWLDHDLDDIPKHLLDKIGCLADSTMVVSSATDLFGVFNTFFMMLENSKEIRGVSPIFIGDMTTLFIKLVAKKIDIELIFTADVLDATLRTVDSEDLERTLAQALKKNLKIFQLDKQPNFAATVTDYFLFIGFFKPDGQFDWTNGLLSYSPNALAWGRELYAYYVEKAKPVIL